MTIRTNLLVWRCACRMRMQKIVVGAGLARSDLEPCFLS